MIPDKFNRVDLEGIDVLLSQGVELTGLYSKLNQAIESCRYQILSNWKFDGILIPPTYVHMVNVEGTVYINQLISVTSDDVIHIHSIEEPANIEPITISQNGVYQAGLGVDGYSPVTVQVPSTPDIIPLSVTENGVYVPQIADGYSPVNVNVPLYPDVLKIIDSVKNDQIVSQWSPYNESYLQYFLNATFSSYVVKINNLASNRTKLAAYWVSRKGVYNSESDKAFLGRGGYDRAGIIFATKIPGSVYSSLKIRFQIDQGSFPEAFLQLSLVTSIEFGDDVYPPEANVLYQEQLASDVMSDTVKTIDVSSISSNFYVCLADYSGYVKIRDMWLEKT